MTDPLCHHEIKRIPLVGGGVRIIVCNRREHHTGRHSAGGDRR